jgi:branched-chain amino acid transport system ATP-binding protein
MNLLEVKGLSAGYGKLCVLKDVNCSIAQAKVTTILGSNGAGKSTLIRSVSAQTKIFGGEIRFDGQSLLKLNTEEIFDLGISQVPEGRQVFSEMSVYENLRLGDLKKPQSVWKKNLDDIMDFFPLLTQRLKQSAGTMSGGEQQLLAIARGLVSKPRLLMLDEPSMGLAPQMVDSIFSTLRKLCHSMKLTILMAEQNMEKSLRLCDTAIYLENGEVVPVLGPNRAV